MTSIEWTDATWNPVVGCRRVSPGCEHCYAETMAKRLAAMGQKRYLGLVTDRGRWTGEARMVPDALDKPLRWRKPRMVFVNSMSDLFHEDVSFDYIAAVFGVMAASPEHTFQVLTKRPERMRKWFRWVNSQPNAPGEPPGTVHPFQLLVEGAQKYGVERVPVNSLYTQRAQQGPRGRKPTPPAPWPLPNVWLGVSAEDQQRADERIPLLLQCPAAVRFVSAEPLLGPVDIMKWLGTIEWGEPIGGHPGDFSAPGIDWVIVGGESGHGARPCNVERIRSVVRQCSATDVPCFVKQLGTHVRWDGCSAPGQRWPANRERAAIDDDDDGWRMQLWSRKGGDPSEWPEDLRVRQWPVSVDARIEEVTGG